MREVCTGGGIIYQQGGGGLQTRGGGVDVGVLANALKFKEGHLQVL
jgi:hypothetical protein